MLLTATAIVAGCFDYREEIWFNADMSGTISMDLSIGEMFVGLYEESGGSTELFTKEGIQSQIGGIDGVTVINVESYTVGENRRIQISLKYESFDALKSVFERARGANILGEISLARAKGGMTFTRTVAITDSTIAGLEMYDEKLAQRYWVSRVHFPGYVSETNAPENNIDEKTQTIVTWGYGVALLTSEPRTMTATFSEPSAIKTGPAIGGGIVFLIVLFGLYKVLGGTGKKKKAQA